MIKIPATGDKLNKSLRNGQIRLAHYPNGTFCWAVKNLVNEVRYFDLKNSYPPKICENFVKSKSYLY